MNCKLLVGVVGVAGTVGVGLILGAGPLEPPAGPVASTSPSLMELESAISGIADDVDMLLMSSGGCCPPPKYRYILIDSPANSSGLVIVNESGVINKIKYSSPNSIDVSLVDQNGVILTFDNNFASQFIELNIRFDGYLQLVAGNTSTDLEIIYGQDSDY